jgi:signal peptidase
MWKGLSVIADSPSPIVVVLSGSMEPAFQRGDLLFLWNRNFFEETKVGEIVVYNVRDKDIPIVHRLVRKFGVGFVLPLLSKENLANVGFGNRHEAKLLTKGDNNNADDTELYAPGQDYIERKDIIGSVVAYIPFVGYVTILLSEHPWLKTVMLGIMGLVVVLQRE